MAVLVTGASGDLGSRVAGALIETLPPGELILASRNPSALEAFAQRGAEVRRADFDEPASLQAAFAGVERVLLISTGIVGEERRRQHRAALEAARDAGVGHVFYTSSVGMHPDNPCFVIPDHAATEAWLRMGGMDFTILRMGSYADILARAIAPKAIASGQWFSHADDGRVAFVSKDDCARACAAALTSDGHEGAVYEITGPELFSYRDAAALAAELSGRPIEYVVQALTPELEKEQAETWIGPFTLAQLNSYEYAVRDGFYETCTRHVELITRRPAQSLRELYRANLETMLGGGA
jgi:NAD(P)H dehydrogenase (quinone)